MAQASAVFSTNQVHEGSFIVYFNGIETPATAVEIRMGVWQIPSATVSVIPDIELVGLGKEDRVPVAVFYLDDCYENTPTFRLIFEGEITGWSYSNSARGRTMNFECISHLAILDDLYPYFLQGLDNIMVAAISRTTPNAAVFAGHAMTFPASLLYNGFNPTNNQPIKRPYDLISNVLRACCGVDEQIALGSVAATNFYSRYIRRHNLINKFLPSPLIETLADTADNKGIFPILKALQSNTVVSGLAAKMPEWGNANSIWGMIQKLFLMMYYEVVAITTPPIAQVQGVGDQQGTVLGPAKWKTGAEPPVLQPFDVLLENLTASAESALASSPFTTNATPNRLLEYITKPQWINGAPPMCNLILPSMIQELSFNEDYRSQPTRVGINDEFVNNMFNQAGDLAPFATVRGGYPQQFQDELDRKFGIEGKKGNALLSGKNFLIWPEEFFKGPRVSQEVLPDWFAYLDQALATEPGTTDAILYQKRRALAASFAHYEYTRQRGASRRGGVTMHFNPYVVPAFPIMIFSDVVSGQNYQAYATSVTHSLSKMGNQTQVGFTFAQTLDELMHEVLAAKAIRSSDLTGLVAALTTVDVTKGIDPAFADIVSAPLNPVEDIQRITQRIGYAEAYFAALFHRQQTFQDNKTRRAAFDYRNAVQLVLPSGDRVSLTDEAALLRGQYLQKYSSIAPTDEYVKYFDSSDDAMRLVSRPICTLSEYISFHKNGVRKGEVSPYDTRQGKGAVFYEQILDLQAGPGDAPAFDENNNLTTPFPYDTRSDWNTKLRNYRRKVILQLHPQEA
jgi:hypothetical protein